MNETRAGQTCIEVLYVAIGLLTGVLLGAYCRHRYGWIGAAAGFIVGAAAWYLGSLALIALLEWWFPTEPPCRCGNRGSDAYQYEGRLKDNTGDFDGHINVCLRCGTRYLGRGGCFQEMTSDGTLKPYLVRLGSGRWRPDNGPVEKLSEPWTLAPTE